MGKALVIVESPSKARTIKKYLGKGFDVEATVGHILDLPPREMGVDVDAGFALKYQVIRGKSKVIQNLKKVAKDCDTIFIGSDPDREGEAIAFHVAEVLGKSKAQPEVFRVLFHEITKRGIQTAMASPGQLNMNRYESQQARRTLDRLVGYQISPLLWAKVKRGLSAGRVQSVAVSLLVDRELEIRGFEKVEYWTVKARLAGGVPPEFEAQLVELDREKAALAAGSEANPLVEQLRNEVFQVEDVTGKVRSRQPMPPFITSKLQQEAHRHFRFSAKRTMAVAQQLYEGIDLGAEGPTGLITYMRTDSTRISDEALDEARGHILNTYGPDFLPSVPNQFKNKKSAQDAHEAIRPTYVDWTPERVKTFLEPDQFKLYSLIWRRFVASQMTPEVVEITTVDIRAGERCRFRATGTVQKFPGHRKVYQEAAAEDGKTEKADVLPQLEKGQILKLEDLEAKQNFTQPPARYTDATFIKLLEEKGIGRPSTYATILSTILDRKYAERDGGKFRPTELGFVVTELLRKSFPEVLNVSFTAQLEEELDEVEDGNRTMLELVADFWTRFSRELESARDSMADLKRQPISADVSCDLCSKPMVIKFGRNGEFLACSDYPTCKNTSNFKRGEKGEIIPELKTSTGLKCPDHDKELILRNGRFGPFLACPDYPECKFTMPAPTGLPCPKADCKGELVERRSKKGRTFFRCNLTDSCEFVMFGTPVDRKCPMCGNPFLEESNRRGKGVSCPNPDCSFTEA